MFKLNGGLAQTQNEPCEVIVSQFSESKQEIRSIIIDSEPWFVAKDVCDTLGHTNPSVAIKMLDDDERGKKSLGRQGMAWVVNESGLYALILRSNKPYARQFRKWITSEVLPSLRKRGHYSVNKAKNDDYVDARNVPYGWTEMNGFRVRTVTIDGQDWFSINDINRALHSATGSYQLARKLNAVETLAAKIFIFGNTYPAWFANKKGLSLILSGSRKNTTQLDESQLCLPFGGGE
ncbi:BRO family, N-terminal domain [Porphyromonadaceae bacterium KHP3R9]|nr:BRO family, N-terminal domain [Porphyromonadaceae bacterium KHP3R9]